jgi:hypothetical protein
MIPLQRPEKGVGGPPPTCGERPREVVAVEAIRRLDLLSSNDDRLEVKGPAAVDVLFPSNLALCQVLI